MFSLRFSCTANHDKLHACRQLDLQNSPVVTAGGHASCAALMYNVRGQPPSRLHRKPFKNRFKMGAFASAS